MQSTEDALHFDESKDIIQTQKRAGNDSRLLFEVSHLQLFSCLDILIPFLHGILVPDG